MNSDEFMKKSRDAEARGLTLDEFLDEIGAIAIGFGIEKDSDSA